MGGAVRDGRLLRSDQGTTAQPEGESHEGGEDHHLHDRQGRIGGEVAE
jgi:hypothetical protein